MREDRVIQEIFNRVGPFVPEGWTKIVFYAEYDQVSYSMEFYATLGEGFVKCFDLPGVSRYALIETFDEIDKVITTERRDLSTKNLWTNMTLVVAQDGRAKAEYDYTDLTEKAFAYKREWKRKYLV